MPKKLLATPHGGIPDRGVSEGTRVRAGRDRLRAAFHIFLFFLIIALFSLALSRSRQTPSPDYLPHYLLQADLIRSVFRRESVRGLLIETFDLIKTQVSPLPRPMTRIDSR